MQAQTRMENAQSRYERGRGLAAKQALAAEELGNVICDYRAAEAEHANQVLLAKAGLATIQLKQAALAVAQQQLKDTQVRVPTPTLPVPGAATGLTYAVTQRTVAEGTQVRSGTEVCKLVIDQTLKLRVPVPERYSTEVRLGQKAAVSTAAFSRPFAGTVTRVNPAVEPTTRTFEVEIQVLNSSGELKPGSFAKAAILTRLDSDVATVPLTALVNFAGINKVFLAENGRAKVVQVTLGVQTTEWVEITGPALPRGAQVITTGHSVLAGETPVSLRAATNKTSSATLAKAR
jgi:RND family efflux transporter MFP subunit